MLVDIDPKTGRPLNYLAVAKRLEERIRAPHARGNVDIHIIGFAKLVGDIVEAALGVFVFFGIAFFVTAGLVQLFTRSAKVTLLPLSCSVVAVIWALGIVNLLGFGLDPMSILAPFLIFAIGVSHGLQMISAASFEISHGRDASTAAQQARFRSSPH